MKRRLVIGFDFWPLPGRSQRGYVNVRVVTFAVNTAPVTSCNLFQRQITSSPGPGYPNRPQTLDFRLAQFSPDRRAVGLLEKSEHRSGLRQTKGLI